MGCGQHCCTPFVLVGCSLARRAQVSPRLWCMAPACFGRRALAVADGWSICGAPIIMSLCTHLGVFGWCLGSVVFSREEHTARLTLPPQVLSEMSVYIVQRLDPKHRLLRKPREVGSVAESDCLSAFVCFSCLSRCAIPLFYLVDPNPPHVMMSVKLNIYMKQLINSFRNQIQYCDRLLLPLHRIIGSQ